ncbi:DUF4868 domain-containing protein [Solibacillus sp. MA9]|uniref:DUF4868 domain-containing protein n=1 Tax=Solibacillus palustris TaxID=2908203 RepID=A0ABS9UEE9_9BACL|nr:Kiwa anti-phage protein KwaB-like domain-containing protein [Solibacillus sp. MA9]MCH7322712.1 DUF4868 domain-containing protein [Solibacillus sp. MA9]
MNIDIINSKLIELLISNTPKLNLFIIEKIKTDDALDYFAHKLSLSRSLQKEIVEIVQPTINKLIEKEQIEYNENGRPNGVVEYCEQSYVGITFNNLLNSLNEPGENVNDDVKKDIYCIKIEIETGKYCYLINRIPQFKKFSKGLWGTLADSTFRKVSDSFIGIEPNFDLLIYENEILIINNVSMQRIFDLKTKYIQNASTVLNSFEETHKIEGFDQFKVDSIEDGNIVKRISRLMTKPERMTRFVENFIKVEEIITEFDLNIELNDDKTKIKYTDKKQLNDIVKLLNDAYYKTVLSGEKGRDDLR